MPNNSQHKPTSRRGATLADRISSVEFSRRKFIIGGIVAGVAIASTSGIYYAIEGDSSLGTKRISVPSSSVFGLEDCEQIEDL